MKRLTATFALLALLPACAGSLPEIGNARKGNVSAGSQVTARALLAPEIGPEAAAHLAMAEEIYKAQLLALQQRREDVRSRRRLLHAVSFSALGASGLGLGAATIGNAGDPARADEMRTVGYAALGGVATGVLLEMYAYMQEPEAQVTAKIERIQAAHEDLLERVRTINEQAHAKDGDPSRLRTELGTAIERFTDAVGRVNVKG